VVNTSPPLKFLCVAVAHGATHTIPADAVPICFVETNATDIVTIQDMRPSRFSYPFYAPWGTFATNGSSHRTLVHVPTFINKPVICGYALIDSLGAQNVTLTIYTKGRNSTSSTATVKACVAGNQIARIYHPVSHTIGFYEGGFVEMRVEGTHSFSSADIYINDATTAPLPSPHTGYGTQNTWAWKEWNSLY
jgi:hypothetical protein